MPPKGPPESIKQFLDRLEKKANESLAVTEVTYFGRAVSRSENSLHLCSSSGTIGIPFDDIVSIVPSGIDQNLVSVVVRNADRVEMLRPFRRVLQNQPRRAEGGREGTVFLTQQGIMRELTVRLDETDTITGGRPDA